MKSLTPPCALLTLTALLAAPASAQWSTELLSVSRTSPTATSAGDLAFIAGGRAGNVAIATVDIYDDASGVWRTPETLPAGPRNILAATAVGRYVLFAGGSISPTASTDIVEVYDTQTSTWLAPGALSQARFAVAAATIGDIAMFAGGALGGPGNVLAASDVVDLYDSSLGAPSDPAAWSTATPLSVACAHMAAATVGDQVVFAGGLDLVAALADVDIYDASAGAPSDPAAWTTAALSEARVLYQHASATVGALALFGGGIVSSSPPAMSDVVDIYDATTGAWTATALSSPRTLVAAAALGNTVLFAGGVNASLAASDVVDVYDAGTGTFGPLAQLSIPRYESAAISVGGRAMFAGGSNGASNFRRIDVFEPLGVGYCSVNANSTGQRAAIGATGGASVVANSFGLEASDLPIGSFAYFLTSRTQGFVVAPGGNQGNLCLGGAIGRFVGPGQVQQADGAGAIALQLDLSIQPTPTGPVMVSAGETWSFQAWYRDSVGGAATSNFTGGLAVRFRQ
ncbi:MAG: hypothetical protein R3F49_08150 [Planctomycetota bacterium]